MEYNNIKQSSLSEQKKKEKYDFKTAISNMDAYLNDLPASKATAYFDGKIKGGQVKKGNTKDLLDAVLDVIVMQCKAQSTDKKVLLEDDIKSSIKNLNALFYHLISEDDIDMTPLICSIQGILNTYYKENNL